MFKVVLEIRYRRHKLSFESGHYEVLFGIRHPIGIYKFDDLINLIKSIFSEEHSLKILKLIKRKTLIRIYLDSFGAKKILPYYGLDPNDYPTSNYDYILEIEKILDR